MRDGSLLAQVLVAALIVAAPLALVAAWSPLAGTAAIALAITAAAMVRPG